MNFILRQVSNSKTQVERNTILGSEYELIDRTDENFDDIIHLHQFAPVASNQYACVVFADDAIILDTNSDSFIMTESGNTFSRVIPSHGFRTFIREKLEEEG